jgi:hypothetical protein
MCLHPRSADPVPRATARAAFPKGNGYLRMRDEFGPVFEDEEFAALFPACGKHAAGKFLTKKIVPLTLSRLFEPYHDVEDHSEGRRAVASCPSEEAGTRSSSWRAARPGGPETRWPAGGPCSPISTPSESLRVRGSRRSLPRVRERPVATCRGGSR